MYDVPSRGNIAKVTITAEAVTKSENAKYETK